MKSDKILFLFHFFFNNVFPALVHLFFSFEVELQKNTNLNAKQVDAQWRKLAEDKKSMFLLFVQNSHLGCHYSSLEEKQISFFSSFQHHSAF